MNRAEIGGRSDRWSMSVQGSGPEGTCSERSEPRKAKERPLWIRRPRSELR